MNIFGPAEGVVPKIMVYLPVPLGILTAISWGTSDYLSRSSSRRIGHFRTSLYMHAVSLAMMIVSLLVLRPVFAISLPAAGLMVFVSVMNFSAFVFLYRGMERGMISVVEPIAYSYPAITTVFAVLFLAAEPGPVQVLALSGVIAGVLLVSTRFSELKGYLMQDRRIKANLGVGSAAASSVLFGVVYVGLGYVTPSMGYFAPPLFLRGVGSLFGLALAPFLKQRVTPGRDVPALTITCMAALETLGIFAFNFGVTFGSGSLPVVASLSGMGGVFATLYAVALLRERVELNQIIGIVVSSVSVFALLLLGRWQ